MLILVIILFFINETKSINISATSYVDLPKCCEPGSVFVEQNDSFFCNVSERKRVLIQTKFISEVNNTDEFECVETVNLDLFLFKRSLNKTVKVKNINDKMLPKCCPLDYFYDSSTYSCTKGFKSNSSSATFVKVGLQNCKIVYDYLFQNMEESNLYITNSKEKVNSGEYCLEETVNGDFVLRMCKSLEFCRSALCLHKCCPDGQSFVNGSHCEDTFVHGMNLNKFSNIMPNISAEYAIIHGYKSKVYIPPNKNYHFDENGNFYTFQEKIGNEVYSSDEETYCFEHATKGGRTFGHILFRIFPQQEYMEKKFLYNRWAMITSNVFLVITIFYYVFSKETRKVFGKTLVSFCSALFSLFAIITYCTFKTNLNRSKTMATCKTIGFLLIYFSFSCFVWLQVMCYDIYWTFGSSKRYSSHNSKQSRDLKRFVCYSLYGWGLPLIITLISLLFHFVDILPLSIKIKMGETKCLIERGEDNYAEILFYIIPLSLIQTVNVIFFVKTVRYCLQVKGNIQKMNQSVDVQKKQNKFRARKERFGLVIKLSFVMGFFYLFEVVSSFYDFKKNFITEYVEIVWDFINCLQGLFIFFIFIFKMKFFKKCSKKVAIEKIRKISLTTTISTRTTALSSERKFSRDSKRKLSKEEENNKFG